MKKNLLLPFLPFLASPALAENLHLNDTSSIKLGETVVAANKWRSNSAEQAKRIVKIRPEMVAFQQPQTAADLLGLSGEVFIQKSQLGGGSPMIRGFATNRLLYVVDGVRMNTAIFRSGNLQNVISLDPFALQNTEVVFGPGSVIYGSDAMGGVMSFQTKSPQFSESNELCGSSSASLRYASANNERSGHFDVAVGGKKWAWLSSVSLFNFDDLRQGKYGPDEWLKPLLVERQGNKDLAVPNPNPLLQSPSGYSQLNLMQKLAWRPAAAWEVNYGFHYSRSSEYARYDRMTRLRKGQPRHAEWNYGPQQWIMNQLSVEHAGNNALYDKMALRLAAQNFEESRIDRAFNKNIRTSNVEMVDAYSANWDFTKNFAGHSLYYGLEYVHNRVKSTGEELDISTATTQEAAPRYPQSTWNSYAAYLQSLFRLSPKWSLETGLRYNHYSLDAHFYEKLDLGFAPQQNNNKASLSASLGVSYRPTASWLIALNAGRGFRTPNVDDMGKLYESVAGAVVVPNPNLKPEYANNVELGLAKTFGTAVKIDLSAYYTHLENALVRRDFTINGNTHMDYRGENVKIQAIQNAASAHVMGVQLGLRAKLGAGFAYDMKLNWQQGEEELDNGSKSTLRHAAPAFGRAALQYDNRKLSLELNTQFQAQRTHANMPDSEKGKTELYALDGNGNTYAPAWWTLNLKGQYRFTPHFSLSAGLENIADKRYRYYSSGISAAGRNFVATATYQF